MGMNRREFLLGTAGIAAAAALPMASIAAISPKRSISWAPNILFNGEIGRWDGVRIYESSPKILPSMSSVEWEVEALDYGNFLKVHAVVRDRWFQLSKNSRFKENKKDVEIMKSWLLRYMRDQRIIA